MLDVHFSDTADKDNTPNGKQNKSHEISNKEDEDLHRSPKDCSRLRGLEQKLQETTDKNTKLVKNKFMDYVNKAWSREKRILNSSKDAIA